MQIIELNPSHAAEFQRLRLRGLKECPLSFASSFEEEVGLEIQQVEARLRPSPDKAVIGGFAGDRLVSMCGVMREQKIKLRHKAWIWGVYVEPEQRGLGLGRKLATEALKRAEAMPGLRQIYLGVGAANKPALRLYESLGFSEFGREPGSMMVEGELHDEISMALVLDQT